jgi:hypothetical protein
MAWCAPQCSKPHLLAHNPRNALLPFSCYLTVRDRAIAALKTAYRGEGFLLGYILDSACPGPVLGVMAWCAPKCSKPHLLAQDPRHVLLPFDCYLTVRERAIAALKSAYRGGGFLLGHIMDSACPGPVLGARAWCAPQCSKPHLLAHNPRNELLPFRCYLTVRERAIAALKSAYRGGGFLLGYILDSACPGPVLGVMAWCAPQSSKPHLLAHDPRNVLLPFRCYLAVQERAIAALKSAYRGEGISFRAHHGFGVSRSGLTRYGVVRSAVLQTPPVISP